ncbi:GntR family transcriptional regulator [Anaerolentibacter hominis]|uniref:GntR family transcriptional regulator n=1 Tax=Anaerolentibacter hominis TaxID=3079009 RepID=UPI0031B86FFB
MKNGCELYRLVYDYYSIRILFGLYSYGSSLPSIPKISARFQLAVPTVRSALNLLEQDGYIKVEASRPAKVIYRAGSDKIKESVAGYFLPRIDGLRDIEVAGPLLFDPLWAIALRQWKETDGERLRQALTSLTPGALFMPVAFYSIVFSSLGNRLLLNLYWEMARYICFPYLPEEHKPQKALPAFAVWTTSEIIDYLKREYTSEYTNTTQNLFAFLEEICPKYSMKQWDPVPFEWNICWPRPQMRYSLAADIIQKVITGFYPSGSYLPSLTQMSQQYGVAVSTVRRTLNILSHLGVVKSYQGKGTQIFMSPHCMDLSQSDAQGVLTACMESLQLLAWTARTVSLFTFESASEEKLETLATQLRKIRQDKKSYLYMQTILSFIIENCPSAMVRECYRELFKLLICGYPLIQLRLKSKKLNQDYCQALSETECYLNNRDLNGFVNEWSNFLSREQQQTQTFFVRLLRTPESYLDLLDDIE